MATADRSCRTYPSRGFSGDLSPIWPGALDPDALWIIKRLRRHGHRAYLVGGCVRDLLLGKIPKDFDIATSARPRQVKKIFRNSRIIGRRFRLVHVHFAEGKVIEVSTFRRDPRSVEPIEEAVDDPLDVTADEAGDDPGTEELAELSEEPGAELDSDLESEGNEDLLITHDNVFGTEEEDALRRDFTINALFFDFENDSIIDYVGGVQDLQRRVVRTIGDAATRVREDPVRILRAVKFATRLDLTFDADLAAAMAEYHVDLVRSAPPRVLEELLRMLGGPAPAHAVEILARLGILWVLLPELNIRPHGEHDERLGRLLSRLRVLAELDRGRRSFPPSAYFGALLYDVTLSEMHQSELPPAEAVDEVIRPFVTRFRMSRRDAARMRSAFLALRRIDPQLSGPSRKRRRNRVALGDFVRREYFRDGLLLFRLACESEDRDRDALETWLKRAEEAPNSEERGSPRVRRARGGANSDPSAPPSDGPRRRKRRRRRGPRAARE